MPGDKENQQLTSVVESIARIKKQDISPIQKNKILQDITYIWSLKNKESVYSKTETYSQIQRTNQSFTSGESGWGWGHDRCMGFRGTNDYVQNRQAIKLY